MNVRDVDIHGKYGIPNLFKISNENELLIQRGVRLHSPNHPLNSRFE